MDAFSLSPYELPDLSIDTLGSLKIDSPLIAEGRSFVNDDEKVLLYTHSKDVKTTNESVKEPPRFEKAGPRRSIFFEPSKLTCGIVTCGGLCPGLNDVIRTITLSLLWQYNVKAVYGFRYGYMGLSSKAPKEPIY
jgi:6-phosphofructokinase 1